MTTAVAGNDIRTVISNHLKKRKLVNPSFSLRALAGKLGVSPGTLSLVINGKRDLSSQLAEKILFQISDDIDFNNEMIVRMRAKEHYQKTRPSSDYKEVDCTDEEIRSNWYYFAILSLIETNDFKAESSWIANRLGITEEVAGTAFSLMLEKGMINFNSDTGRYTVEENYTLGNRSGARDLTRHKHNLQNLELAAEKIQEVNHMLHDFSHITMAIDPSLISEARHIISNFRRQMCELLETSPARSEVYKLCIQLFPLSNPRQGEAQND